MDNSKRLKNLAVAVLDLAHAIERMHPTAEALASATTAAGLATEILEDLAEPTPAAAAGEGADAGAAGGEAA